MGTTGSPKYLEDTMTEGKKIAADDLNRVMDFDHVIRVNADGTVTETVEDAPYFDDALVAELVDPETYHWETRVTLPEGWKLLNGFSGQYGYSGPEMHTSEYIGGGMARYILETPGDYVALIVEADWGDTQDTCSEVDGFYCEPDGWAVAYKPAD
jgi:hypothetical protein